MVSDTIDVLRSFEKKDLTLLGTSSNVTLSGSQESLAEVYPFHPTSTSSYTWSFRTSLILSTEYRTWSVCSATFFISNLGPTLESV